ncbi:MAG: hypothetical protein ACFBSE_27030, partial [Prochloraceae cyanobacterium]
PEIKEKFTLLIEEKVAQAKEKVNQLADSLKGRIQQALNLFVQAIDKALNFLANGYQQIVSIVKNTVKSAIDSATGWIKSLGDFAVIVKDVAANPKAWLANLQSSSQDGVQNHLWAAFSTQIQEWFNSKLDEVLGLGQEVYQLLALGGMGMAEIGQMAWNALSQALPAALATVLMEKLVALIVPAAGTVMIIIEALQAAWGAAEQILQSLDRFMSFLKAVKGGNAGPLFAGAIAAGGVAVVDFISNWLVAKLASSAEKVSAKLKRMGQKFGQKYGCKRSKYNQDNKFNKAEKVGKDRSIDYEGELGDKDNLLEDREEKYNKFNKSGKVDKDRSIDLDKELGDKDNLLGDREEKYNKFNKDGKVSKDRSIDLDKELVDLDKESAEERRKRRDKQGSDRADIDLDKDRNSRDRRDRNKLDKDNRIESDKDKKDKKDKESKENKRKKERTAEDRKDAAKKKFISVMKAKKSMSSEEIQVLLRQLKNEFDLSQVKFESQLPNPRIGFYASPATFLPLSGWWPKIKRFFNPRGYDISGQKPGAAGKPGVSAGDYIRATHYDGPFPTPGKQVIDSLNNRFQGQPTFGGTTVNAIRNRQLNLKTTPKSDDYRRPGIVEAKSSVPRGPKRSGSGQETFGHFGVDEERIITGNSNITYQGGHLVGDQIMDSFRSFNLYEDWNLAPQQTNFNHPAYANTIEAPVTAAIKAGATIKYTVRVQYPDDTYRIRPSVLAQNLFPGTPSQNEINDAIKLNPGLDAPFTLRRRTPGFWQATAEVIAGGKTIDSGKTNLRADVVVENNPVNVSPGVDYQPKDPEQVRYSLKTNVAQVTPQTPAKGKPFMQYNNATRVTVSARQETFSP